MTSEAPLPRWALPAFFAGAAVLLGALSCRALSHSEVRYVEAGWEMASAGDWVVPHLSFVPYFEKPAFTYWAQALAQILFGASALATRMPSIASCLVMLWATWAIGRELRGPRFGLGAAALLLSAAGFTFIGTAVTTDPIFAAFLALAGWAYVRHDREPRGPWIWVFWGALGFAVLTKGPLGLVLSGSTVGAHLLLTGRWRDVPALRLVRGGLVVALVNVPWSVLAWARDPRFLEFFYVRENFRAAVDSSVNHAGGWWYYVPVLPAAFFPFALVAAWAIGAESFGARLDLASSRAAVRDTRGEAGARFLLVCMVVPPVLFLSVAQSKLATYVLPLLPGVALLVAWHVADRLARPTAALKALVPVSFGVVAAGVAVGWRSFTKDPEDAALVRAHAGHVAAVLALLAAGFAGATWLTLRGALLRGFGVLAAASAAATLVVLPVADAAQAEIDTGPLVARLAEARQPGERVVLCGSCTQDFTVSLGLRERTYVWGFARETGMGHFVEVTAPDVPLPRSPYDVCAANVPQNPWLLDDARFKDLWTGQRRVWVIGRPKDIDKLRGMGLPAHVLACNSSRVIASNLPGPGG
jgi:4-amino-4-deoxy-L-arabinose transferase-like glycosyltransferase